MKFNYSMYQTLSQNSANRTFNRNQANQVGYLKLSNGESAIARFNIKSLDDLEFATIHRLGKANKYMAVSCLRPLDSRDISACPFCKGAAEGNAFLGENPKRVYEVYIEMNVKYFDKDTGKPLNTAEHIIWGRSSVFVTRKLVPLINDFGELDKHVFKITRIGEGQGTDYTISCIPVFDRPEVLSDDFSVFKNYQINGHSYWEKTKDEMEQFLTTGQFPKGSKTSVTANVVSTATIPSAVPSTRIPAAQNNAIPNKPSEENKADSTPVRNFSQFKF